MGRRACDGTLEYPRTIHKEPDLVYLREQRRQYKLRRSSDRCLNTLEMTQSKRSFRCSEPVLNYFMFVSHRIFERRKEVCFRKWRVTLPVFDPEGSNPILEVSRKSSP